MALELVADVAAVYDESSDFLRRAYNQAFFERLWVRPVRDGDRKPVVGAEMEAELAWPYDMVLAPGFSERVDAEVAEIEAVAAGERSSGPAMGAATVGAVSIFEVMAEGVGFEPTGRRKTPNGFQGRRIQPLCHPS